MLTGLVIALQLQCGIQKGGSESLRYGTLIYRTAQSATPQFAYFEELQSEFSEHPLCAELSKKMHDGSAFEMTLDSDGKKILSVD